MNNIIYFRDFDICKINIVNTDYCCKNKFNYNDQYIYIQSPIVRINSINNSDFSFKCTNLFSSFMSILTNRYSFIMWKKGIVSYYQRMSLIHNESINQIQMKMSKNVLMYNSNGDKVTSYREIKEKYCEIVFHPIIDAQNMVFEVVQLKGCKG